MFYAGAHNHEHQQIGLATSLDGRHFTRIAPDATYNLSVCKVQFSFR